MARKIQNKNVDLEDILEVGKTLFYSDRPSDALVLFTEDAVRGMDNLREESAGIRKTFGGSYEFIAFLLGRRVNIGKGHGEVIIVEDYIMPKTFVTTETANMTRPEYYRDSNGNRPECVLGRNFVTVDDEFIDRAYAEAYCLGLEVVGIDHTHEAHLVPSPADVLFAKKLGAISKRNRMVLGIESEETGQNSVHIVKCDYAEKVKQTLKEITPAERKLIEQMFPRMEQVWDRDEIKKIVSRMYEDCKVQLGNPDYIQKRW